MRKIAAVMMAAIFLVGASSLFAGGQKEQAAAGAAKKSVGNFALILATGGLGDQSFNDLTYAGMKRAEKELGITFDYVEPKEIADYAVFQRELADSGKYGLIICVGFDQADALQKVAAEYPKQKFGIIDMVVDQPNVASYVSEEQQGSFLVGALVGLIKKNNAIPGLTNQNVSGVIGGMDIPLIHKFVAGYMAGARYVNPGMKVYYDYVGDWSDPTTAKQMADTMYNRGADIIYQAAGGSGLGVFRAAEEKNLYAIGVNSNQNHISPDHIVASMLKRVDNACFQAVQSVVDGTFKPGVHTLGVAEGGIGYTTEDSNIKVPDAIIKQVNDLQKAIADGKIKVPTEINQVDAFLAASK